MPVQPSDQEEAYFARNEYKRLREAEDARQKALAEEEKQRLKDLHYMSCPKCGMKLVEIDYRDMKIDKCTACEGVWLDPGELEALSKLEKGLADKFFGAFLK